MGAQRKEISFQLGQVIREEGDIGARAGKMKETCILKWKGKSRGLVQGRGSQREPNAEGSEGI